MSTVEFLINFVNERLSAAVDEIFTVFENTIVKYEQDIERQRRLLESFWKPEIKLQRIDHPQLHVTAAEKVLPKKRLCNQERNCSLNQEEPGPPHVKQKHKKLLSNQQEPKRPQIKEQHKLRREGVQSALKRHTESFVATPVYEEHREQEPNDGQILFHSSPNWSLIGSKHVRSGSAANVDEKQRRKRRRKANERNCRKLSHVQESA
ncbi:uncharacterized protein LOC113010340 [Astatotilapia calliptera]|uniref:uncharacterized protein LOC113010340 n=1 Tax=Astatotilapia calliptera TaxID=8154 RepID=UPI000329BD0E|nr:uncharacterized protein LOC101472212 [Maylandia zebra]XP_026005164.1 uncharacterized protein LOC113010340 [Astatotilapia calliptera]